MSNNWYSICVNGKMEGFFHSTRGIKQGDPLFLALFILGADVLSRSLNILHKHQGYHGFFMEMIGPQVNHLSFVDNIILFTLGRCKTLKILMQTLKEYENTSWKLINAYKIHFMLHSNAFNYIIDSIKTLIGFMKKSGSLDYLRCAVFICRPRIIYLSNLVNKVVCRITSWQTKQLSHGGREILPKHVLQALSIHLLSSLTLPSTILKKNPSAHG